MRAQDRLAEARRRLPRVRLAKDYLFREGTGTVPFSTLFGGHSQLIIYHFMFGTDWEQGCPSCSFWADNFDGIDSHLAARDASFAVISKAPWDKLAAYRARMGWRFRWLSASDTTFNEDFNVSFTPEAVASGQLTYNYRPGNFHATEAPGLSVFERAPDGGVLHFYSTYGRGLEAFNGAYHLLDLTPRGRDEGALDWPQQWVRRHDQYH
jgi:predicted dithiol-disulfide oxidoreductase (DUF899 family)